MMDDADLAMLRLKAKGLWDTINPLSTIETMGKAYLQNEQGHELERYHGVESPVDRTLIGTSSDDLPLPPAARGLSPEQVADIRSRILEDSMGGMMDMPPSVGAIRKTPTGKFLGTVSDEVLSQGQKAVDQNLIRQAKENQLVFSREQQRRGVESIADEVTPPQPNEARLKALDQLEPSKTRGQLLKERFEENYGDRFGDNPPKNGVFYNKPVSKQGDALVIDTYGRGDVHNAPMTVDGTPKSSIRDWNKPHPFPGDPVKIEKALSNHDGPIILGAKSDPFMWMDSSRGATRHLLEGMEGKDLTIRTRSDLVGRDDYIGLLKRNNTTVDMVMPPTADDELVRLLEPGAPSVKRRLLAAKNLQENGIKVNLVQSPYDIMSELKKKGMIVDGEGFKKISPELELQKMKNMMKDLGDKD